METVSKYSLNPLATCFIPSSMKNHTVTSVFSVLSYESSAYGLLPIVGKQQTVNEHFGATTGGQKVLSNPVKQKTVDEELVVPAMQVKEMLSNTGKEEVYTAGQLSTKVLSTIREGTVNIHKLDDEKILERRSEKSIVSKDTSLTEFDNAQPKQILGKIFKYLKRGTKINTILSIVLPYAMQSLFKLEPYGMVFNKISLDFTLCENLYSVFKSYRNAITYPKTSKKTKRTKDKPISDECRCPPMFGWIVPLDFFGNPLKLAKTCSKDYSHANVDGRSPLQPPKSESFMSEDELSSGVLFPSLSEQCSLELKAVIKDVCDSISLYEQVSEESNNIKVSKTRKRPIWEIESGKEVGTELLTPEVIDDGFHPLLEEISSADTEDADIASIQRLLGEAFSPHKVSSGQEILPSQSDCNPPCSIWCNKVPPSAKDTYKRFIKKLDSESTVHQHVTEAKTTVINKPLYRRCFSADDTPKSSDYYKAPLLSGSDFESRERIMLLRKDPISFIKQSSTVCPKDSYRKSRSNVSAGSEQVATKDFSNKNGCGKSSFYDGADSLWQPLPDCIQLSDSAQKHSLKKVRDIRRQKSVC